MKIVEPSYEILTDISEGGLEELKAVEQAARTCYKSLTKDFEATKKLISSLIAHDHLAMLEFGDITVRFVCDRGVSHELVRHRMCSFAQESTRYCNYSKEKYGCEITVVRPLFTDDEFSYELWKGSCEVAEKAYLRLLDISVSAQDARSVLPNSLKTEVVMKGNYREWRHIFELRTASGAHPEMRRIMAPLQKELRSKIPIIFDDYRAKE